jgi:hypothetical protein
MASPGQAVVTQTEEIEACETKVVNSQTVVRKMNENTGRAAEHGQMQIHNDVLPWDVHTLMSAQSISLGALFDNMLWKSIDNRTLTWLVRYFVYACISLLYVLLYTFHERGLYIFTRSSSGRTLVPVLRRSLGYCITRMITSRNFVYTNNSSAPLQMSAMLWRLSTSFFDASPFSNTEIPQRVVSDIIGDLTHFSTLRDIKSALLSTLLTTSIDNQ